MKRTSSSRAKAPRRQPAAATVQPVLDAIARTAARLCEAHDALIHQVEGDQLRLVAKHGRLRAARDVGDTLPLGRDWVGGQAVLDGKAVHVRDVTRRTGTVFPGSRAAARVTRVRTLLAAPLLRNGTAVGAIVIRRTKVRPFTAKQIALLKSFADQAALAIENAQLFKELGVRHRDLTEALEQQTATSEILRVISSSPTDVRPTLDALAAAARRLCGAMDAVVALRKGDTWVTCAHDGPLPTSPDPRPLDRGSVLGRAILDGRTVHLPRMNEVDPQELPLAVALARQHGFGAGLAAPMLRDGVAVGVIGLRRGEEGAFTSRQIGLLETFADQAVIAIENVRLFTELEARNSELRVALEQQTATSEILRAISSSPTDVQPVFDTIVRNAVQLCGARFGVLHRFDGERLHLVAHDVTAEVLEVLRRAYPMRPSRSQASGRAILTRAVAEIRDVREDPEYQHDMAAAGDWRSLLAVPMLRADGSAIGTIVVQRSEPGPFASHHIEMLKTFADQAVIAIDNVRLFRELEVRNRDLTEALEQQTATSEILRVISSSPTDLQPVFNTIAASATRLCDALFSLVFRFDGEMITLVADDSATPEQLMAIRSVYPTPPGRRSVAARAIHERRVIAIADSQASAEYPHIAERARAIGYRSLVSVPMLRGGMAIGAINVIRVEATPFTDTQIELLKTFADQAVIAIENVRLFTELESRNRDLTEALEQQTATSEILRVISSSPTDVQPVFDTIVASAVRLCRAHIGAVYRFDGEMLHLAAHYNFTPEQLHAVRALHPRRPQPDLVSGRAILSRAVAQIEDILAEPAYHRDFALATGWRSMLAVPMLREGEPIGAIVINRSEAGAFSDNHVDLLKTFADQAVIAIENVRLFNELQSRTAQLTRSVDELTALGEVSRALSSTLDLETVLNTIVARANQLAGTDACSVWEYDEVEEVFHLRATDNLEDEVVAIARRTPIPKGQGAQGQMAVTREPVQIADTAAEDAYRGPLRDVLLKTGTRAILAVPLLRDDHLVGGLTVNRKTPGEFPPETVELLKTFATQSALAIQNARLFREIEDKGRQLEIASQHKSQFLANMSHELRTPLNAILGYTELMADSIYGEVPERMREVLERVDKSGRHLLGLINDILDLSKIEAGQLTLALAPYAMDGVAQTVATQVGALAAEKQLGFEVILPDDLPLGHGDERRLIQVLLNLVGNAIKFTDAGSVVVRVGTSDDAFVVSVTDTGPGIAEGDREKIFEEFQQADTTRAKAKGGTGLGLAISRRIVEMHGGRLWVDSTLGQGSAFSFTVPVHVEQQAALARPGTRA